MAYLLTNSMTRMQHLTPRTVSTVGTSDTLHERFVRITTYATSVLVGCILDDAFSDDAMLTQLKNLLLNNFIHQTLESIT